MKFKLIVLLIASICSSYFVFAQQQKNTIEIINHSKVDYLNTVVEIPWSAVIKKYGNIDTANFKIINIANQQEVAFQLESKGTHEIQNLLVQVSVPKTKTIQLKIVHGKKQFVQPKVIARYVPERKDDFAWENDKIAFRMYGKALEQTPKEMAYGIDIWVKRTNRLVINERYKKADYHVDHGDGLDYYHVGLTLGAGNMMPIVNDSISYSKNYVTYKILDSGPLRTTFQLFYDEWLVNGIKAKAVKTISLDEGSQLNKIKVEYISSQNIHAAAGIIVREKPSIKYFDEQNGILAYWEPTDEKNGTTGVACIFPNNQVPMKHFKNQLVALPNTQVANTYVYYTGAAWDKAGEIKNMKDWFEYLSAFKFKIENPLAVQ